MKKIFFILEMIGLFAYGESLPLMLNDLRERISLVYGEGINRSPRQVMEEKQGNHEEIVHAFQTYLDSAGISSSLECGQWVLSEEQKQFWGEEFPLPETQYWLTVQDVLLPDFGLRHPERTESDYTTVRLFPQLTGRNTMHAKAEFSGDFLADLRLKGSQSQWTAQENGSYALADFSASGIKDTVAVQFRLLEKEQIFQRLFSHSTAFPGYTCANWLTLHPIDLKNTAPASYRFAMLKAELLQNGQRTLLFALPQWQVCNGEKITLQWETAQGDCLQEGTVVFQNPLVLVVKKADQELYRSEQTFSFQEEFTLRWSRWLEEKETDSASVTIRAGEDSEFLLSAGSPTSKTPADALQWLCKENDAFLQAGSLAVKRIDASPLHIALSTRKWTAKKIGGTPYTLISSRTLFSHLPQGKTWIQEGQASQNDNLLQAFLPLVTQAQLLWDGSLLQKWTQALQITQGSTIHFLEGTPNVFCQETLPKPIQALPLPNSGKVLCYWLEENEEVLSALIKSESTGRWQVFAWADTQWSIPATEAPAMPTNLPESHLWPVAATCKAIQYLQETSGSSHTGLTAICLLGNLAEHLLQLPTLTLELPQSTFQAGTATSAIIRLQSRNATSRQLRILKNGSLLKEMTPTTEEEYSWDFTDQDGTDAGTGLFTIQAAAINDAGTVWTEQEITRSAPSQEIFPENASVRLLIPGLEYNAGMLNEKTTIYAIAENVPTNTAISLWMNDTLLAEGTGSLLQCEICENTDSHQRFTLQAKITDPAGNTLCSPVQICYFSPYIRDKNPPIIQMDTSNWPLESSEHTITVEDQSGLASVEITCQGEVLFSKKYTVEKADFLQIPVLSAVQWQSGITCTATDQIGNQSQRTFRFAQDETETQPQITLDVSQKTDVEENLLLMIAASQNLAKIELWLNDELRITQLFPEENTLFLDIPQEWHQEGENEIRVRGWSAAGQESPWAACDFQTPVIRAFTVTPEQCSPWNGTPAVFSVSASMKLSHEWQVSLLDENGESQRQATGSSAEIQCQLDPTGLPDGPYQILLQVPEMDSQKTATVLLDAVIGEPIAQITYPAEDALVREGVLQVKGTAANSKTGEECKWKLSLKYADEKNPCFLETISDDTEWRLSAKPSSCSETSPSVTVRQIPMTDSTLAALDLSALPDGSYLLELETESCNQTVKCQRHFLLNSNLKLGDFSFQESGFKAFAGNMAMDFSRKYSTQNLNKMDFGCGWSSVSSMLQPAIDETREEQEGTDGTALLVRSGGTRDVSVTMRTGQRINFLYSLEKGGSTSFCYYARWKGPAGLNVSLVPTCSNKLMTIPGLDPYWEAAGNETPWDLFDFPGFRFTDTDGTVYLLERPETGSISYLVDGEPVYVSCRGDLQVTHVYLPTGEELEISDTAIIGKDSRGQVQQMVQITKDLETGLIRQWKNLTGDNKEERFTYDDAGNLIQVEQFLNDEWTLHRQYEYTDKRHPHHLTAIRQGNGSLLLAIAYDDLGRRSAVSNGDGLQSSTQTDVFDGLQITQDSMGREITSTFSTSGELLTRTMPGGRLFSFAYDANGQETCCTLPDGSSWATEYDNSGNVAKYTFPSGVSRTYQYQNDQCVAIQDEQGKSTNFYYGSNGALTSMLLANGSFFENGRDAEGRMNALSVDGKDLYWIQYDDQGRMLSMATEAGSLLEQTFADDGALLQQDFYFLHPETGELITRTQNFSYDKYGRLLRVENSDGEWESCQYDGNGLVYEKADSHGVTLRKWYDTQGRIVQSEESGTGRMRCGYDAAGQCLFVVYNPEETDDPDLFQTGRAWQYDEAGNIISEEDLVNATVSLTKTGIDVYQTKLLSWDDRQTTIEKQYDLNGRCIQETSAAGRTKKYEYDADGRVIALTDEYGNRQEIFYDAAGFAVQEVQPNGGILQRQVSKDGRTLELRFPDGESITQVQDGFGRLLSTQDGYGRQHLFSRGEHGVLLQATPPALNGTKYAWNYDYNALFMLKKITSPQGDSWIFSTDEQGRRLSVTSPAGRLWKREFSLGNRNPTRTISSSGAKTEYEYDLEGRLTGKTCLTSDGSLQKKYIYQYDTSGRLRSATKDENGQNTTRQHTYNARGLLLSTQNGTDKETFQYDADGILTGWASPHSAIAWKDDFSSRKITFHYEELFGKNCSEEYVVTKDTMNQIREIQRPDGSRRIVERNAGGIPLRIQELEKTGSAVYQADYTYGKKRELLQCTESYNGKDHLASYEYDEWGRLLAVRHSSTQVSAWNWSEEYTYDLNGNRLSQKISRTAENQTHICQYDQDGCLLLEKTDEDTAHFQWNQDGQLVSVQWEKGEESKREYAWDAEGKLRTVRRQFQNGTTLTVQFEYGIDGTLQTEFITCQNDASTTQYQKTFSCAPGIRKIIHVTTKNLTTGQVKEQHLTWLGEAVSLHETTDGSKASNSALFGNRLHGISNEDSPLTTAWGEPIAQASLQEQQQNGFGGWCWNGEWMDTAADLVLLQNRFYSPRWGRFLSPDQADANLEAPETQHRYAYCCNDPVNAVDPSGNFLASLIINSLMSGAGGIMNRIFSTQSLLVDKYLSYQMPDIFASQKKTNRNAAIIVHGVGEHTAQDFQDFETNLDAKILNLNGNRSNMDYYDFHWSGFVWSSIPFLFVPTTQMHDLALMSLINCMGVLYAKQYRCLNVISHSWGTVLSKDALNSNVITPMTWTTMGSPLVEPHWNCYPNFPYGKWLNIAYSSDVVSGLLKIEAPDNRPHVSFQKHLWEAQNVPRLSQLYMPACGVTSHTRFWTDGRVLQRIAQILYLQ